MKLNDSTTDRLWQITEPLCNGAGYELVDLALVQSRSGWTLRVFIDHLVADADGHPVADPDGGAAEVAAELPVSTIEVADCARISRELSAVLDVEDPIPHAYELEVSSPGLDRPLRKVEHFQRFIGHEVKITLDRSAPGRRNFKGILRAVNEPGASAPASANRADSPSGHRDEAQAIIEVDGKAHAIAISQVARANLIPNWDALFTDAANGTRTKPARGHTKRGGKAGA